jgi:hypothetical protein
MPPPLKPLSKEEPEAAKLREAAGPGVFRILPTEFRAKARAAGPSGN